MADEKHFKAIFSAVDKISPQLKVLERGFKKLETNTRALASVGKWVGGITVAALSGVSIAASIAFKNFVQYGDEIGMLSEQLDLSSSALQKFEYAAKMTDVPVEALHSALSRLRKGIGEAMMEGKGNTFDILEKIGINQENVKNLSIEDQFIAVAESISKIKNPTERATIASKLFGKSYAELLPLLNKGRSGIAELFSKKVEIGLLDENQIEQAGKLDDALKNVKEHLSGLSNSIMSTLAPALTTVVDKISAWINKNRALVSTKLAKWIEKIAKSITEWVESGGIDRLLNNLSKLIGTMANILDLFGGFGNLLMIIAGFVGFTLLFTGISAIFNGLVAIKGIILSFQALSAVMGALGAPLLVALALVAVAIFMIWKNWDEIVSGMKMLWEDLSGCVINAWDKVIDNVVNAMLVIAEQWQNITDGIQAIWDDTIHALQSVWEAWVSFITSTPLYKMISMGIEMIANLNTEPLNAASQPIRNNSNLSTQRNSAALKVEFANAPIGLRVIEKENKGFEMRTDVGYINPKMGY